MDVRGLYYEEGRAKATPAVLSVEGKTVVLRAVDDGRFLGDVSRRDADVSMRVGDIPRQVSLRGGWTFETDDNAGIDRLLTAPIDNLLPWLEKGWERVAIATLIFIGLMVCVWRFGIPAATQAAVNVTPTAVERSIATGSLRSLDASVFEPSAIDADRREALDALFTELVQVYRTRDDALLEAQFELLYRKAPMVGANAFALPGGKVILTDELLALIDDDALIGAIMAHEIGHVHHRHTLYSLYRSTGVSALILFLGGDLSQLAEDAVVQGAVLSNLASSRRMEREADVLGVELSLAAGIDPEGLITALELLSEECDGCEPAAWLSTHPGLEDRAENIRKAAEAARSR